jgi:hypothetical protein
MASDPQIDQGIMEARNGLCEIIEYTRQLRTERLNTREELFTKLASTFVMSSPSGMAVILSEAIIMLEEIGINKDCFNVNMPKL